MIRVNLILLFLINCTNLFGQYFNRYGHADTAKIFALNKFRYQVDAMTIKGDPLMFVLDSIDVSIKRYSNKTETTSFFRNSKSVLSISFYFVNCNLLIADVKEQSPLFADLNATSIFYFENDSIFYSDYYFKIRPCMLIPLDKSFSELYGYNPNLDGDLLKKYVKELYSRINNMGSSAIPGEEYVLPVTFPTRAQPGLKDHQIQNDSSDIIHLTDTSRKIVTIDSLKNGEKYFINVESNGCFHHSELYLAISKTGNHYYATFKMNGKIEGKKVKKKFKKTMLNESQVDSIRTFENELIKISSKSFKCTTVDTYFLTINSKKSIYKNDNCAWKMGIGRLSWLLFKQGK
jgi:hypothetical protein